MSGKKAKAARQAVRPSAPPVRSRGSRNAKTAKAGFRTSQTWILVAGGVVALLVLSFVLPGVLGKSSTAGEVAVAKKLGVAVGAGLPAGSTVPAFSGTNLQTGQRISSTSVYTHKTLLFFSEGVMCQACFEQIQGIEQVGNQLAKRGIQLVSITTDTVHDLEQAQRAYGIDTPLISDANRRISEAFNTLGQGMHTDTPGHAFALIYRGKVLWYRDYYLPPYRTMYVQPRKLLTDIANT
jgi:peroxiredoxin